MHGRLSIVETAWERAFKFAFICGLHVVLLIVAATITLRPQLVDMLSRLDVRLVQDLPPTVKPVKPRMVPPSPPEELPKPQVVATTATTAPVVTIDAKPVTLQNTPPRFDADYLHNPEPEYPALSRRLGEQGRVMLRVLVSAEGNALTVEIERSSGYLRLDAAALEAVHHWRFVPAKSGSQTVEDWVLVPIMFKLT